MATNDLRLIPALDPTPTEEDDQLLDNILHWHRLKIRLFLSGLITNHRVKAFRAGVEWTVKDIMNIDPNEKNTYTASSGSPSINCRRYVCPSREP